MSRRMIQLMALLLSLALVFAACGSDDEPSSGRDQTQSADGESTPDETDAEETDEGTGEGGVATYVATEFAFEGPDSLPSGTVALTMDNQGEQMHELALGELLGGKSMSDVDALLKKGLPKKPPKWFRQVGGTGAQPGESGTMDAELTPGRYVMICFVPDTDSKKPHVMLGMMKEVTVE